MLNLPVSGVESVVFIIFFGMWASFLYGGFVFGSLNEDETRRMPLATRLLSSAMLSIAGWTWFAVTQGTEVEILAFWLAIGMTLGLLGDAFMAELFTVEPYVLYGMGAFGLGHIAYIIGIWMTLAHYQPPYALIATSITVWWAIAAVLWYGVVYLRSKPSLIVMLALPYALLLATTVAIAMLLLIADTTFSLIFFGAMLFLVSDLLLASQLFSRTHFRYISDMVWLLYGPGQMLIVFSVIIVMIVGNIPIFPI